MSVGRISVLAWAGSSPDGRELCDSMLEYLEVARDVLAAAHSGADLKARLQITQRSKVATKRIGQKEEVRGEW